MDSYIQKECVIMPIISFLTPRWQKLTAEQTTYLRERSDIRFKDCYPIGWGRRFSILRIDGEHYGIDSAYGMHHLENLMLWLDRQRVVCTDYSVYLNQGMKELGL